MLLYGLLSTEADEWKNPLFLLLNGLIEKHNRQSQAESLTELSQDVSRSEYLGKSMAAWNNIVEEIELGSTQP